MRANPKGKLDAKWVYLGALTLALGLTPLAPAYAARQNTKNPPRSRQSAKAQKKTKTYVGTVEMTRSGKCALIVNPRTNKGWFLNDQSVVKKYVGQKVRILGTLNPKTGILQVRAIHPVKG